jgi:PncC family amidohydrolase
MEEKAHIAASQKERLEETIGRLMLGKGLCLTTAESCTGGLLSHTITNVPGSSSYYKGGIIAYDNAIKKAFLSVSTQTLEQYGAVSAETASEMARGVIQNLGGDIGVAITGVAGPSGGSREKPVGTVFIAVSDIKNTRIYNLQIQGSRGKIKIHSTHKAMEYLKDFILHV